MAASNPHNESGPNDPTLDSVLGSASSTGAPAPAASNPAAGGASPAEDGAGLPQGEPFTPHDRVVNREAWDKYHRQVRLGMSPPEPPTLGEGGEQGTKSPGFDTIRGADDVAGAMVTYQNQLMSVLTTMQKLLIEGTARLEALQAYFDRLR